MTNRDPPIFLHVLAELRAALCHHALRTTIPILVDDDDDDGIMKVLILMRIPIAWAKLLLMVTMGFRLFPRDSDRE